MFARTRAERARNSALVNRRRMLLEAWIEPKLRRAMRKLGTEAALEYTRGGIGRVEVIAIGDYRDSIKGLLVDLYSRTSESMASIVQDSAKSFGLIRETKDLDTTLEMLLEQFNAFALDQSKTIANSMKDEIVEVMEPLVREGAGEKEIGRAIRSRIDDLAPWRANMIARTETLMASSWSQDQVIREMELPPMAKEWDSSRDSRTRKTHRAVEPVFMEEKFSVGGRMMQYPGDRAGGIKEIVNCRCVCNYAPADQIQELRDEVEEREQDTQDAILADLEDEARRDQ